jgi:hypothetical protein
MSQQESACPSVELPADVDPNQLVLCRLTNGDETVISALACVQGGGTILQQRKPVGDSLLASSTSSPVTDAH